MLGKYKKPESDSLTQAAQGFIHFPEVLSDNRSIMYILRSDSFG